MSIAILCPNGHKLLCPEQQAGKRGKCPHCGATFRVPELPPVGAAVGPGSGPGPGSAPKPVALAPQPVAPVSATPQPIVAAAGLAPAPVKPEPPAEEPSEPENLIRPYEEGAPIDADEIIFLCPNGHHLCGPTSLGGHAGECPECGTKFLVPSEEDAAEPERPAQSGPGSMLFNFDGQESEEPAQEAPSREESQDNSLVDLFDSFWAYKAEGASVELHLGEGQVIIPDGYAPHLSRDGHGVFMIRENSGLHTLAAVAWNSVVHVAVRGIRHLPEGVFDEP
jgi:hypothetical protein